MRVVKANYENCRLNFAERHLAILILLPTARMDFAVNERNAAAVNDPEQAHTESHF